MSTMKTMEVYESFSEISDSMRGAVVAIGSFDGLHLGHNALFQRVHQIAQQEKCITGVVTFDPHPVKVLAPTLAPPTILSRSDKIAGIAQKGFDYLLMQAFTPDFAQMAPEDFATEVLKDAMGVRAVVVGYDFSFGRKAAGKAKDLKVWLEPHGVSVHIITAQSLDGLVMSSTKIRAFILEGNVHGACTLLGRPFRLSGPVVSGDQRGRSIGTRTANVQPEQELIPKRGVYAAHAIIDGKRLPAVINVGLRPTFEGEGVRVEAHLLDFDADLYGSELVLEFVERIRPERKFPSKEALVAQIQKDIAETKKILEK
ncbi:MAG: riboflavin biosynthesis protein RibF [Myxococcales bacterium]|nr:riboflavin biosynthesis protein RibF [Myxococcales bacterium]